MFLQYAVVLFACAAIVGCASSQTPSEPQQTADADADADVDVVGKLKDCLGPEGKGVTESDLVNLDNLGGRVQAQLDDFLDCFFGPRLKDGQSTAENVRLLRGHIATAVVARYGAFNVTGEIGDIWDIEFRSYEDLPQHAGEIVLSLSAAQRSYRAASGLFSDAALQPRESPLDFLERVQAILDRLARLERVLIAVSAASDAAKPSGQRARRFVGDLMRTFRTPTKDGTKTALGDLRNGLKKLAVLQSSGGAYRVDVEDYLTCAQEREAPGSTVGDWKTQCTASMKTDWQQWDGALDEACDRLALRAGIVNACTPGTYKE